MEVLGQLLANYGVPGVIMLGMAGCIFVLFRRMDEHEQHCERYRAEMRDEMKETRHDIGDLRGDIKALTVEIRNGNGTGCAASKRRKTSRPVARTRKAGAKRGGGTKKTSRRR